MPPYALRLAPRCPLPQKSWCRPWLAASARYMIHDLLSISLYKSYHFIVPCRYHSGGKAFTCRHCSAEFPRSDKLGTHLLKSHGDGTWFSCPVCQLKFSRRDNLRVHVRRHESARPFVCAECSKSFHTAPELRKHQPVHAAAGRALCCFLCDAKFRRKADIMKHFKECASVQLPRPAS